MSVAFLFLTRGRIHPAWEDFFQPPHAPYLIKNQVYIHAKHPEEFEHPYMCHWKSRLIVPPVKTKWGHLSQIYALHKLLEKSYQDSDINKQPYQYFFYASESCVPLVTYSLFMDYIVKHQKGFLSYRLEPSRYHSSLKSYIGREDFSKMRGQGWLLPRTLVGLLLKHASTDIPLFKPIPCPTEHYFINFFLHYLSRKEIDRLLINRPLTFFNWKEGTKLHPKEYHSVSPELIADLYHRNYLCMRKVHSSVKIDLYIPLESSKFKELDKIIDSI